MSKLLFFIGLIVSVWAGARNGTSQLQCQGDPNCQSLAAIGIQAQQAYSSVSVTRQCLIQPKISHRFENLQRDNSFPAGEAVEN